LLTGVDSPQPVVVGGLDTHAGFEGDTSMTRGDAFFGDNHSFNETLFDQVALYLSAPLHFHPDLPQPHITQMMTLSLLRFLLVILVPVLFDPSIYCLHSESQVLDTSDLTCNYRS
jgi:hypothetical protein